MSRTELIGHHAIWWRSTIKREGDKFVPTPPFHPYDPFEHYWPQGRATRGERSLLYLFLDVDSNNPDQILSFTQRFGVLGDTHKSGWSYLLPKDQNRKLKRHLGRSLNRLPSEMRGIMLQGFEDLIGVKILGAPPEPVLCEPMTIEAFRHAQDLVQLIVESLYVRPKKNIPAPPPGWIPSFAVEDDRADLRRIREDVILENAPEAISNLLSHKLSGVRPRLTWNPHSLQWETAWDVGSLEAAIYLMLLFDMQGRGHILKCPWCNAVFLGDHPRTEYCSRRCQNSAKVARHRANKSTGSKKGNKQLKEMKNG